MGQKRKENPLGLPTRVHWKHGAFWYVHKDNRWERLGTDINDAKLKGSHYNKKSGSAYGTMSWFLDEFLDFCEMRINAGKLSVRTRDDYTENLIPLKSFFGKMTPTCIEPHHVAQYLDFGAMFDRPIRANREKACLSACFSWMIRTGRGEVKINPCIGVRRNKETKRRRYVEHWELEAVLKIAPQAVRCLAMLVYRTLQRPEDILSWTTRNIVRKQEPSGTFTRVIRNVQGKTGTIVDIQITPEIESIFAELRITTDVTMSEPDMPLIHRRDGNPYTYDGLSSMLKRCIDKANDLAVGRNTAEKNKPVDRSTVAIKSFGFYDFKGKGATDMWHSGVQLERIQHLCGHKSVTTTEIYVKARWRGTATPNKTAVGL